MTRKSTEYIHDPTNIYYHTVPRMAVYDLDVWEFKAYNVYKMVCGERGECTQATSKTADLASMSIRKLRDVRQSLVDKGYIKVTPTETSDGGSGTVIVEILDIWPENILRFKKEEEEEGGLHEMPGGAARDADKEYISSSKEEDNNNGRVASAKKRLEKKLRGVKGNYSLEFAWALLEAVTANWWVGKGGRNLKTLKPDNDLWGNLGDVRQLHKMANEGWHIFERNFGLLMHEGQLPEFITPEFVYDFSAYHIFTKGLYFPRQETKLLSALETWHYNERQQVTDRPVVKKVKDSADRTALQEYYRNLSS